MLAHAHVDGPVSVDMAKAMFQRTLTGWASDVLALRKRGWDKPCLRLGMRVATPVRRVASVSGRRRAA